MPCEYPAPLRSSIENVSENIERDVSPVSALSPVPEKSPLKERKGMPVSFVITLFMVFRERGFTGWQEK